MNVDLYEIIISVELDRVRARIEKYSVKQTTLNFLPQRLTVEQETQGYSHRLCNRVPVDQLMRVHLFGMGENCTHVHRSIYCFADQREDAFRLLKNSVSDKVFDQCVNSKTLYDRWKAESADLQREELPRKTAVRVRARKNNR